MLSSPSDSGWSGGWISSMISSPVECGALDFSSSHSPIQPKWLSAIIKSATLPSKSRKPSISAYSIVTVYVQVCTSHCIWRDDMCNGWIDASVLIIHGHLKDASLWMCTYMYLCIGLLCGDILYTYVHVDRAGVSFTATQCGSVCTLHIRIRESPKSSRT